MKGLSKTTMNNLWRNAVLKFYGGKCVFCGCRDISNLECHHIKKRKHKLTRFMVQNGVPVCKVKWGKKLSCHQFAETFEGQEIIRKLIGEKVLSQLDILSRNSIKQWCVEHGITENQFILTRKEELQKIIKGD